MTAPAPLAYPGSRTLAAWWGQLAAHQPTAWWVCHLLLHRIDALVGQTRPRALGPFERALLVALAAWPGRDVAQLDESLRLGQVLLSRALREMADQGLAAVEGDHHWRVTDRGRAALEAGEHAATVFERRPFFFTEGGPDRRPHFLAVPPTLPVPHPTPSDWAFDGDLLRECVGRSADWKADHGFPKDMDALALGPCPSGESGACLPTWRRAAVDHAVRLPVALVRTADDRLLGFAIQPEKWVLQAESPAFAVGGDWATVFPELAAGPSAAECQQAWQGWCQPRGVVNFEAERIAVDGFRLRIEASGRGLERIRGLRTDISKGDGWVLAGAGKLRAALLLEIAEATVPVG